MTDDKATTSTGLTVHAVTGPTGMAILHKQRLSISDLAKAITAYTATERVCFGTFLGLHDTEGVFFSEQPNWTPDSQNAFAQPFGVIPWVQIHELLGNVPEGTTFDFLNTNGKHN